MSHIKVSQDIIPIGKFQINPSKWLQSSRETGRPIIITQNGKPAGVLLSPAEYDMLTYEKRFADSIRRGLEDAEKGKGYSTDEANAELDKRLKDRGF